MSREPEVSKREAPGAVWPGGIGFLWVAAVLPAVLQLFVVLWLSLSVPYQDDYDALLRFAIQDARLPGMASRILHVVWAQHNEYKLMFEHALLLGELVLTRRVDFRFLNVIGDLLPFILGSLVWVFCRNPAETLQSALRRFIPISLVVFSLNYAETMDWAMASLQNFPVIIFAMLSLFTLQRRGEQRRVAFFALACGAGVLSAASSANGFLLLPVGMVVLIRRRAYGRSAVWFLAFLLAIAAYLYHYVPEAHPVQHLAVLRRILFFMEFLGGALPTRVLSGALGLCIVAVWVYAVRLGFHRRNPLISLASVWIAGTAALVAWVRGGAGLPVSSRYAMYSDVLLAFCIVILTEARPRWKVASYRKWNRALVMLAVLFCVAADVHGYLALKKRRAMVMEGIAKYKQNPIKNSPMNDPRVDAVFPMERADEQTLLSEAIHLGLYRLPR